MTEEHEENYNHDEESAPLEVKITNHQEQLKPEVEIPDDENYDPYDIPLTEEDKLA